MTFRIALYTVGGMERMGYSRGKIPLKLCQVTREVHGHHASEKKNMWQLMLLITPH